MGYLYPLNLGKLTDMKRVLYWRKVCLGFLLMCFISTVNAATCFNYFNCLIFKPYLGIEYQYEHIKSRDPYHLLLSANFQYANLFLGAKYHKNFGVEIGYYRSLKTSQNQFQFYNWGGQLASGITAAISRTSFKGFSFDWSGYYKLDPDFNIFASLGLVTMHETLTVSATGSSDLAPAIGLISGKNTTAPRVGGGVEYLYGHWGLRSRLFWVYTQNIKLNVTAAQAIVPTIKEKAYLQAVEATVGIFYRF